MIGVRLVFSQETIGELMYIFKRYANSFNMRDEEITDVLSFVTDFFQYGKSINTKHLDKSRIKKINDPEDQMFVYAAYASEATHLITLDKESGILNLTDTPFTCCTPTEYLEENSNND